MSRKDRVESAVRSELADLVAREVKDPRVQAAGIIGVSKVSMSSDLSVANVYVSIFADEAIAAKALAGLTAAAGFLRGPLGRRLHLQRPPELHFHRDNTAEMSQKLASIVRDDVARASAAGRTTETAAPTSAPAGEAAVADAADDADDAD